MGDDGNPENGTDGDNDIIGEGDPLTDHIRSMISNPDDAFVEIDLTLANVPDAPIDMLEWYRDETGRTKDTDNFVEEDDDYDRRSFEYFLNDLDVSFATTSEAYTAASGGCPVGNLNAFPDRYDACVGVTVANEGGVAQVGNLTLWQSAPNPTRGAADIAFELGEPTTVSLAIFDVLGRRVATVISDELRPAGPHSVRFEGSDSNGRALASGIYLYQLRAGDAMISKRMTVVN